jgi:hypothetical protein
MYRSGRSSSEWGEYGKLSSKDSLTFQRGKIFRILLSLLKCNGESQDWFDTLQDWWSLVCTHRRRC